MPSKSAKQARFMAACAHGAKYSSCPPAKVSHEFNQADKGTGIFKKAGGGKIKALEDLLQKLPPLEDTLGTVEPNDVSKRLEWLKASMLQHGDPEQLVAPHGEWGWKMTTSGDAGNDVPDLNIDFDSWKDHVLENLKMHPAQQTRWASGGGVHYRGSKPATPEDELTVGEGLPTPGLKKLRDTARALTGNEKHDYLPRVLRSLVTQFSTLGPDNHPEAGLHPGLVDSALSTPELIPLLGQLMAAADKKWPSSTPLKDVNMHFEDIANWDTPQWSKDASERYSKLDNATRIDMGLTRPRGFGEHAADALGVMAGQIPLLGPLGAAKPGAGLARKVLGAVPEYLGPTIRPSVGAYSSGAIGGGILGGVGDPDQDTESNATHWAKGGYMNGLGKLRNKYADGGKVGKSAEAIKAIKNAMAHLANRDSQSAVSVLQANKEATSDPNVKAAIDDLTKAKINSASQRLNKTLESDSDVNAVPLLAKGGKVGAVESAVAAGGSVSFDDYVNSLFGG